VYVTLLPADTGLGAPLFVTDKSQTARTGVLMLVLLLLEFGSVDVVETDAFAVMEVAVDEAGTLTMTRISADVPEAMLESVQTMEPVVVQDHPAGGDTETKVAPVGIGSVKVTPVAVAGPLLVTVCT
jgi:hypothetical protein